MKFEWNAEPSLLGGARETRESELFPFESCTPDPRWKPVSTVARNFDVGVKFIILNLRVEWRENLSWLDNAFNHGIVILPYLERIIVSYSWSKDKIYVSINCEIIIVSVWIMVKYVDYNNLKIEEKSWEASVLALIGSSFIIAGNRIYSTIDSILLLVVPPSLIVFR